MEVKNVDAKCAMIDDAAIKSSMRAVIFLKLFPRKNFLRGVAFRGGRVIMMRNSYGKLFY